MTDADRSFRLRMISAFAAVYVIWGSTYLAIRFAIETLPGFTMAGARFLVAGTVLYVWARLRGASHPNAKEWRSAIIVGGLLLLGGNGLVVWAQHFIPSGWTALLIGSEPLWVTIILLVLPGGNARPTVRTILAIIIGFAGVAVLTAPASGDGTPGIHLGGALAVLLASASWASGSVYGQRADLPSSPRMAAGAQMLGGGLLLSIVGAGRGEWRAIDPSGFSTPSILAFCYLVVFGSLVAFSAYTWLVRNVEPTLVATTAYVNPVVAIILGWLFAGESIGIRTWIAMTLIVGAVILLSVRRTSARYRRAETEDRAAPEPLAMTEPALDRCG